MDFADQFTFKGTMQLPGAVATNVVAVCRQARFDSLSLLEVHIIGGDWAPFAQRNLFPGEIEIVSDDDQGRIILGSPVNAKMSLLGAETEVTFSEWTRLPADQAVLAGEIVKVEVELAAAGLLRDRRNTRYRRDGSVEKFQGTGDRDLSWKSKGRSWTAAVGYHSAPLAGQASASMALISCGMIQTEWQAEADTSLKDVVSDVEAELRDSARLLSFVSRASTPWSRITVNVLKKNGRHVQETATKRVTARQLRSGPAGPMFSQDDAANCFEGLLGHLATSSSRAEITRAIDFVVASWCAENMPSALVLLHAALETIVAVADATTTSGSRPSSSQLGKLEDAVRRTIRDFGANSGWSSLLIDDLLEKSPEVKRPPIVRLICRLLPVLDVYTKDLWRDAPEIETELREAFSHRNKLVHAAVAEETIATRDRLMKLALLTERIILRMLGLASAPHPSHNNS
jgi:hypothetical protein